MTQAQREKQRGYHRRWRERNPEKFAESQRRHRQKAKARIREYERSEKELARRAAAKRRLRRDPAWAARERARVQVRRQRPDVRVKEAAQVARWKRANAGRVRELNARRRARELGAAGVDYCTAERLAARRAFYGGRCAYCGAADAATMDHVIPLDRGGSHFPSNQVPACTACNSSKGTKLLVEWRAAA